MTPLVEMRGITKSFPGVLANDRVDLAVYAGEVHALLGENGAGKTTLMNILYGLTRPTAGTVLWEGCPVSFASPKDAIACGIGMVHQHFMLVPALTVAENVVLGHPASSGILRLRQLAEDVARLARTYGLDVDPYAQVADLPVGVQQRVEILKALYRRARVLILDEPTAVLTPQEVRELFAVVRQLVARGAAVILISHRMEEVLDVADRITVLRDGRVVASVAAREADPGTLARWMVGREVELHMKRRAARPGPVLLDVEGLSLRPAPGRVGLHGVSFAVRSREVLGIAGVEGNGQQDLAEVLFGLRRPDGGRIRIKGQDVSHGSPRRMAELVARIPADRQGEGLILGMTVRENLFLSRYCWPPFSRWGFLQFAAMEQEARRLVERFGIRPAATGALVRHLSGGNQQKVVLARELQWEPDVIVAVNPTRGLDVGATEFVRHEIAVRCQRGAAVVLISTDLEEVLSLSDRIAVLFSGRIQGTLSAAEADPETLGLLMAGAGRGPLAPAARC